MSKKAEEDAQPEALATFAARAGKRSKAGQSGCLRRSRNLRQAGDLEAEEKDAADILGGNTTGDKKRVDAALAHHAKTDKRTE